MDNILESNDIEQLKKTAKVMGVKLQSGDTIDRIKEKISAVLGDLGFDNLSDTDAGDDAKERATKSAVDQIMSGKAEIGGLSTYLTELPRGRLPNLLPFQNPWGGRRRRIRRIRVSESDQQILFLHWNGYPFVIGLEADYADVPYPHYLSCLVNATSEKLRQKKTVDDEGRTMYQNNFYKVKNFPFEDLGVAPGTEHLPRSMKEFLYGAYVEGFPEWTPIMWKQVAQSYSISDKLLGITPSMQLKTQVETRRMAVMDRLGIIDVGSAKTKREERAEIIAEILSQTPIAEAA